MIEINEKSQCCGCGNCAMICPQNAIRIEEDECGFTFPEIDLDKCTNCNLCNKSCPVLNHKNAVCLDHSVFAAYAKDSATRFNGSSGGMFGLFAENIIDEGGIVYGAAFDENLQLKCKSVESKDSLYPLYKSKYLQSNIDGQFFAIKEHLQNGKKVLFVSTPCQVFALKLFLKRDYENLYTVDFICHGVPSQKLFDQCREYEEKRDGIKFVSYQFRAKKKNGSTPHYYKLTYSKNGKEKSKTKLYVDSLFYNGFHRKYITLRDSCYDCHFSHSNRISDITIGDFHGIDKYISGINRFDGVSTVCINTEKGMDLWNGVCENAIYYALDFSVLLENGELMCGGTQKPANRDEFIKALKEEPFGVVVRKYLDGTKSYAKKTYYSMPLFVRKIMKKIWGVN